jgi:hypothetical protein
MWNLQRLQKSSPRSSSTSEGFAPPPPYPTDDPTVGSRPVSAPTPAEPNDQSQSKPAATL